jgi:hypothetical protein
MGGGIVSIEDDFETVRDALYPEHFAALDHIEAEVERLRDMTKPDLISHHEEHHDEAFGLRAEVERLQQSYEDLSGIAIENDRLYGEKCDEVERLTAAIISWSHTADGDDQEAHDRSVEALETIARAALAEEVA